MCVMFRKQSAPVFKVFTIKVLRLRYILKVKTKSCKLQCCYTPMVYSLVIRDCEIVFPATSMKLT